VATLHLHPDAVPTVRCPVHNHDGLEAVTPGLVPDLAGHDLTEAVALLEIGGYEVALSWADAPGRMAGDVLFQVPSAGSSLGAGSVVTLTLAGPEPGTAVPDVLGLEVDAAREVLRSGGMAVVVRLEEETDPEAAALRVSRVWAQQPSAGAEPTGTVTIWANPASLGSEPATP
jgi:beta-lactam-binding protein with PASTA domain